MTRTALGLTTAMALGTAQGGMAGAMAQAAAPPSAPTSASASSAPEAAARPADRDPASRNPDIITVIGTLSDFGATRSATPILETARSVSVETESAFRDRGALSLSDTLNYTAGVTARAFGPTTRGDFFRIRGFQAAEYRDGQQVLFGFYNNSRTNIYLLDQVEVLKGPASVLFGKGQPGGIVNAVSKFAGPEADFSEIVFDIGTDQRYQVSSDVNLRLSENIYFRTVAFYREAGTQIDFVADDGGAFMPSLTYDNGRTRLSILAEIVETNGDTASQFAPLSVSGCAADDVTIVNGSFCELSADEPVDFDTYYGEPGFNRYDTESRLVTLTGRHEFTDDFSLSGVFRFKDGSADYNQAYPSGQLRPDGTLSRVFYNSDAESQQTALDVRARYTFLTGPVGHEVFAGVAVQRAETVNDIIFLSPGSPIDAFDPVYGDVPFAAVDPAARFPSGDTQADDLGLYINDQISVGPLRLNLGVRYDRIDNETLSASQEDEATSFSAGALYVLPFGISPYFSYAESFEPTIGTSPFTGALFEPQEGRQYEGGIKYQPAALPVFATFAYFDIEQSNLPNPQATPGSTSQQQLGVARVKGFEVEANARFRDVFGEVNLTFLDTEDADGFPFSSVAENQASSWVQYQPRAGFLEGIKVGAGVRYVGERESLAFQAGDAPIQVVTDSVTLADALIGYETDDWNFTLNARNLLGTEYYGTCLARGDCFPGDQRTVVARLARRF